MPRSGRLRRFIRDYKESARFEKLSFIPPFLILFVECVLLAHAFTIEATDIMVVELTTILLIISIVEILLVSQEMHEHYQRGNFDRVLTIKLDDFITQRKEKNVKKIVTDFIDQHPKYEKHRNEIYHIACQILETHQEDEWEKVLNEKLNKFLSKRKKMTVDDLIKEFIKKYPSYKNYKGKIYEKICQKKVDFINKKND